MSAGFEYYGNSTEDIISVPLILVSSDSPGSALGVQRSKLEGDITISRPITNEYGTTGEPLSFTYGLIKSDYEPFTQAEQIIIERWLTSPKLSSELKFINCIGEEYCYYGLFIETEWILGQGSYIMCNFTFQVNGTYPYKYSSVNRAANTNSNIFYILADCQSDELEEYIYPVITVKSIGSNYSSAFTFHNQNDSYGDFSLETDRRSTFKIDCQYNIIRQYDGGNEYAVKYKDIGLSDCGTIYWPRLLPGSNNIKITGYVDVTIEWKAPYKKVGGWLI